MSTILDYYSRYVIAWKRCTTVKTSDVADTLELALQASGCDQANVLHNPRLLSDNRSIYISSDLVDWLTDNEMIHVRVALYRHRRKARSNADIKPRRTGYCRGITFYPVISKSRSRRSSITTTISDTMRA